MISFDIIGHEIVCMFEHGMIWMKCGEPRPSIEACSEHDSIGHAVGVILFALDRPFAKLLKGHFKGGLGKNRVSAFKASVPID